MKFYITKPWADWIYGLLDSIRNSKPLPNPPLSTPIVEQRP